MKQYAILLKGKSLEIVVTRDGRIDNGSLIGSVPCSPSQTVLGVVCFESERHHSDILKEFGNKYPGHNGVMIQAQENLWSLVNYRLDVEPVIVPAFVNYFSRDKI